MKIMLQRSDIHPQISYVAGAVASEVIKFKAYETLYQKHRG